MTAFRGRPSGRLRRAPQPTACPLSHEVPSHRDGRAKPAIPVQVPCWCHRAREVADNAVTTSVFGFAVIGAMAGVVDDIGFLRGWIGVLFAVVVLRLLWDLATPSVRARLESRTHLEREPSPDE